jgi:formylglycine-generating enzyme required for sulfatase activity
LEKARIEKRLAVATASSKSGGAGAKTLTNSIGLKMVLVPAGEFLMGSPANDPQAKPDEQPQHRVRISTPFYLGAFEVTRKEYAALMDDNSHFRDAPAGQDPARLPADSVSWFQAVEYCNKLSAKEGVQPFYVLEGRTAAIAGGAGYRLPTEAEWEFACRSGTTTRWPFGDLEAGVVEFGWIGANSGNRTNAVGLKKPNALGLFDMHGNVYEWCWDAYEPNYYAGSPPADPLGGEPSNRRVVRGGYFKSPPIWTRCSARHSTNAREGREATGFRIARSAR